MMIRQKTLSLDRALPFARIPKEKLLADILKRQAKRIMGDITECPPDTIPAHIARLEALREVVGHLLRHDLAGTSEARLSGAQLLYPSTLADFAAALEITRQTHRAPAFINSRDEQIAEINHKLDTLAGLIGRSPAINALLESEGAE